MKRTLTALLFSLLCIGNLVLASDVPKYALVIHGGAGTLLKKDITPEKEKEYLAALELALRTGEAVLAKGGSSLDAVVQTLEVLEDSPLFNAGKGAVFTAEGTNELDASIMNGANLMAGSVAGVSHIKNPIGLARLVMEKSPHVLLAGKGAETFAATQGIELIDPKYFWTQQRWDQLQKLKQNQPSEKKHGTVGCVALDQAGNIAAGTSTGGTTNKLYGRVGDSPIIGAGTYADNQTCGVSATGQGEFFIRAAVAHDIACLVGYKGMDLKQAADLVIQQKIKSMGGEGGVIVLDRKGNVAWSFNTPGMYRGYLKAGQSPLTYIYGEELPNAGP